MPSRATQPLWNVLALDRRADASLQDQIVAFFRDAVLRGALKRLGFLVAPRPLVHRLTELKSATDRYTPGLMQLVLARFISEGRLAAHVRRMRTLYRDRRAALLAALARHAADVLDVGEPPDAGLHFAVRLKVDVDDVAISRAVRRHGVYAAPLSLYYARPPRTHGFVLGFANTAEADVTPAVRRLARAIRDAGAGR